MNYEPSDESLKNFPVVDSVEGETEPDNRRLIPQTTATTYTATTKLADEIRTRLNADPATPVFITETDTEFWVEDKGQTAANNYEMTISCAGVEKVFNSDSAYHNFNDLLKWLKEASKAPENDK